MNACVALFLGLSSCATTSKGRALQGSVGITGAMEVFAAGWAPYVHGQVAECRAVLPPDAQPEARSDCLGLAGHPDEVDAAADGVVAAQTAIRIAAECDKNPVHIPAEFVTKCIEGQKADWESLAAGLSDAWKLLLPYVEALAAKKGNP